MLLKSRTEAILGKTLTAQDVAALYAQKMPDAAKEEARSSPSTIVNAFMVYEKLVSIKDVRAIIESSLQNASPFNSISKLV